MTEVVEEFFTRSSWGAILFARASDADVSLLFLLAVLACVGLAIYFLVKQAWAGAVAAAFVAVLIYIFLL